MGAKPQLKRALSLPLLLLYGVGTTVGAGIYALLGEISAVAGALAPWAFVLASAMAACTALSFAELANRYPNSAASAKYVEQGLRSPGLGASVGYLVAAAGIVSSAALLNGVANYLTDLLPVSRETLIAAVGLTMLAISCWGISQSVTLASIITVAEVGGLIWISWLCFADLDFGNVDWTPLRPQSSQVPALMAATLLAFYAFIGFEDLVEVAEEVRNVRRTLPIAIIGTLVVTTALYVLLTLSAQLAVGAATLATFKAPMPDLYRFLTGNNPLPITFIGVAALLNGVLIQIIMASRVIYGLASRHQLPSWFALVNARTQTPVRATLTVGLVTLSAALVGNLGALAEITSLVMLTVFALVNLSLYRLHRSAQATDQGAFTIPTWLPVLGCAICCAAVLYRLIASA